MALAWLAWTNAANAQHKGTGDGDANEIDGSLIS
jgi:hypothetical protein